MTLYRTLKEKGFGVHTIGPAATLDQAVGELVRFNIGSLIVCESAAKGTDVQMIGIITERDILRAQNAHEAPLDQLTVGHAMTSDLITAEPGMEIEEAMRLMTKHRVRHLPVMERERLLEIVSIGDVMNAQLQELTLSTWHMSRELQDRAGMWT